MFDRGGASTSPTPRFWPFLEGLPCLPDCDKCASQLRSLNRDIRRCSSLYVSHRCCSYQISCQMLQVVIAFACPLKPFLTPVELGSDSDAMMGEPCEQRGYIGPSCDSTAYFQVA